MRKVARILMIFYVNDFYENKRNENMFQPFDNLEVIGNTNLGNQIITGPEFGDSILICCRSTTSGGIEK